MRDQQEARGDWMPARGFRHIVRWLRTSSRFEVSQLLAIWRSRNLDDWASSCEAYQLLGEKVLRVGEPLLAYDIVSEGLHNLPTDVRLRQLQGLALARSGASERGGAVLAQLKTERHADEETLGMLARTYKDCAARAATTSEARLLLRKAAMAYEAAYRVGRGNWTGINAATTALLIGKKDRATVLAKRVRAACISGLRQKKTDKFWLFATLAEASLIQRDWSQAIDWYQRAKHAAGNRFGDLQSTRRNARLLLRYWKADESEIENCLRIPRVAVFAGHMVDLPTRGLPRFPRQIESRVALAVEQIIAAEDVRFGYASAARGADILFLEALIKRGREICIVLPYEKEQFMRDSVEGIRGSTWRPRFERVLEKAARVVTASRQKMHGISYDYANQLLLGLATIHATQLETELFGLAVWDGSKWGQPGGTASAVQRWRERAIRLKIINPKTFDQRQKTNGSRKRKRVKSSPTRQRSREGIASQVRAILFADAVDFSKLTEEEVPRFVKCFLGAIAPLISCAKADIVEKNTWGDGLYFVLSSIRSAGKLALDLSDLVTGTSWRQYRLPATLNLRIALHAGPVFESVDPITGRRGFHGTHISRAARIEPITPPGEVYASEAFAALAAIERNAAFTCDYAGQIPMSKGYGTFPTYCVRRNSGARIPWHRT